MSFVLNPRLLAGLSLYAGNSAMITRTIARIDSGAPVPGPAPHFFDNLVTGSNPGRKRCGTRGERVTAGIMVPGIAREIQVKIASNREELEGAFRLLAANYRARGYEKSSTKRFRFTPHHVLPDTVTLVAKHEGRVVATLSVVPDTLLCGLPMECIYGAEVDALRREGRRLAEATSLADQGLGVREFVRVFKTLIMVGMQYHIHRGGDSWVISVNPRHRAFYLKVLGFVPLGPRRAYPTVEGHPAEAFLSGVDLLKARAPEMYKEVFGEPLPEAVLRTPRWSPRRVDYFGKRSTQGDGRRIRDILSHVERFGGPPRRWEGVACPG